MTNFEILEKGILMIKSHLDRKPILSQSKQWFDKN